MKRVVITGLGIVSCLGNDRETVTKSLKDGISGLHSKQSLEKIDQETIFCLLSGDNDPINSKGKQAEKIHHSLIELGMKSELKIFKGMRHEPFNELGRKKVYEYILNFFNNS